MLFIPLLILGIVLYFTDKRVFSVLIFFFFLSNGFQLVPESLFETNLGFSKPSDFAVLYVLTLFVCGLIKYKDFIVKSSVVTAIWIFLLFVLISVGVSKLILNVGWHDILRTVRLYFLVLGYFSLRRLSYDEINKVFKYLFIIVLSTCVLYVIQGFTGKPLLIGENWTGTFGVINRYYNIPILYYFFFFYAFFSNPLGKTLRCISYVIFILVAVFSLHRGLMISLFIIVFIGIFIREGGLKGIFKYLIIGGICFAPILDTVLDRFSDSTANDINSVMEGAFKEYGEEMSVDGTFLFRVALFYERYEYVIESPLRMVFGVGFMTEDSALTGKLFDFKIGLTDKQDQVVQLDTSDAAWVNFILRLGFVGTILYLLIYFTLARSFFKARHIPLMLVSFLYILLLSFTSATSSSLYDTQFIGLLLLSYGMLGKEPSEVEESYLIEKENE